MRRTGRANPVLGWRGGEHPQEMEAWFDVGGGEGVSQVTVRWKFGSQGPSPEEPATTWAPESGLPSLLCSSPTCSLAGSIALPPPQASWLQSTSPSWGLPDPFYLHMWGQLYCPHFPEREAKASKGGAEASGDP